MSTLVAPNNTSTFSVNSASSEPVNTTNLARVLTNKLVGLISTFEQDPFRTSNVPDRAGQFIDPMSPNNIRPAQEIDPLGKPDVGRNVVIHFTERPVDSSTTPHKHDGLWCHDPVCTGSLKSRDPLSLFFGQEGKRSIGYTDPMNPNRPYRFETELPTYTTVSAPGTPKSTQWFSRRNNGTQSA